MSCLLSLGLLGCSATAVEPTRTAVAITLAEQTATRPAPTPTVTNTFTPPPTITTIPTDTPAAIPSPTHLPATETATSTPLSTSIPTIPIVTATATTPPPLPTPQGVYSWTLKVPILMYHYISVPPEDADKYRLDLSVSPADFHDQMAYLAENGYETIDLYDLSQAITAKKELPEKPVIITLDDGYKDNYENAFPILQEFGHKATFFVVTEYIDKGFEEYMTWEMVEELASAGMRIEPHSKTHPDLSGQERDYIIYEVLGSQESIAAHIGYTPRYFCYPGGRYDDTTLEIISELDFWGAVTTAGGQWHGFNDRYEWSRMRMRNTTALIEFADFVSPGDTIAGKSPEG
ncbi:MAG: polysaccharide deacetylase family protein [Anaerolineales bacterium]|nr:polysaccharide deacetylase family protein [Anaerolineales bacterium]